jgi:hypothetical protein
MEHEASKGEFPICRYVDSSNLTSVILRDVMEQIVVRHAPHKDRSEKNSNTLAIYTSKCERCISVPSFADQYITAM